MRKEIVYYAFDDTEFDSKQECEQYEKQFMINLNDIIIFDEDMNRLVFKDTNPDVEGLFNFIDDISCDMYYIAFANTEAKHKFIKLLSIVGTNCSGLDNDYDMFAYSEDSDMWQPVEPILCRLNLFNNYVSKIFTSGETDGIPVKVM